MHWRNYSSGKSWWLLVLLTLGSSSIAKDCDHKQARTKFASLKECQDVCSQCSLTSCTELSGSFYCQSRNGCTFGKSGDYYDCNYYCQCYAGSCHKLEDGKNNCTAECRFGQPYDSQEECKKNCYCGSAECQQESVSKKHFCYGLCPPETVLFDSMRDCAKHCFCAGHKCQVQEGIKYGRIICKGKSMGGCNDPKIYKDGNACQTECSKICLGGHCEEVSQMGYRCFGDCTNSTGVSRTMDECLAKCQCKGYGCKEGYVKLPNSQISQHGFSCSASCNFLEVFKTMEDCLIECGCENGSKCSKIDGGYKCSSEASCPKDAVKYASKSECMKACGCLSGCGQIGKQWTCAKCNYQKLFANLKDCEAQCACPGGKCITSKYNGIESTTCTNSACDNRTFSEEFMDEPSCRSQCQLCPHAYCNKDGSGHYLCRQQTCDFFKNYKSEMECKANCLKTCEGGTCLPAFLNGTYRCYGDCASSKKEFKTERGCRAQCSCPYGKCIIPWYNKKIFICETECSLAGEFGSVKDCEEKCVCPGSMCEAKGDNQFRCSVSCEVKTRHESIGECEEYCKACSQESAVCWALEGSAASCQIPCTYDKEFEKKEACDIACNCDHGYCALTDSKKYQCYNSVYCSPGFNYEEREDCLENCRCYDGKCSDTSRFACSGLKTPRQCEYKKTFATRSVCKEHCSCSTGICLESYYHPKLEKIKIPRPPKGYGAGPSGKQMYFSSRFQPHICYDATCDSTGFHKTLMECQVLCNCWGATCLKIPQKGYKCLQNCQPKTSHRFKKETGISDCKSDICNCVFENYAFAQCYGRPEEISCQKPCADASVEFQNNDDCEYECGCLSGKCEKTGEKFHCVNTCSSALYESLDACKSFCDCPNHICKTEYLTVEGMSGWRKFYKCLKKDVSCTWGNHATEKDCSDKCKCSSGSCVKVDNGYQCRAKTQICDSEYRSEDYLCFERCTCDNYECFGHEFSSSNYRCQDLKEPNIPRVKFEYKCDYLGLYDTMGDCNQKCLCPFSQCVQDQSVFKGELRGFPANTIAFRCILSNCTRGFKAKSMEECNANCICYPSRGCTAVADGNFECQKCAIGAVYYKGQDCLDNCKDCGIQTSCERRGETFSCTACESQGGRWHKNLQDCYLRCTCGTCLKDGLCVVGDPGDQIFVTQDPYRRRF